MSLVLGRAKQLIENRKKKLFAMLEKSNMTDEQLKQFCSVFLGEQTETFLMACDKIEAEEKSFLKRQKRVTELWMGFIGFKLMDLDFLKLMQEKLKEFKKKKKSIK